MKYCPQCQQHYAPEKNYCLRDGTKLLRQDPYHLTGNTLAGKYQIIELAGLGGLGAVYKAQQLGIDRQVAFKILQPNVTNKQTVSMFEREAKMAGGLSHENIVTVYDFGRTQEGISYIAMEWLEGRDLEDELAKSGPLSLERTAEILQQITAALEAAHTGHIVHRDLKPSNIMLVKRSDGHEQIKVVDFGIGKVLSDTIGSAASILAGTARYAAPEQFQPGATVDSRADIYSLGVMLFQMLTNKLPFEAASDQAIIQMHREASPPPMRKYRADIPEVIESLVQRMLAKEAAFRPPTVKRVRNIFVEALSEKNSNRKTAIRLSTPKREKKYFEEDLSETSLNRKAAIHLSTVKKEKKNFEEDLSETSSNKVIRLKKNQGTCQFKVLILGTSAVGKTSLISRFVRSIFSDKYHTTVGVKVDRKTVIIGDTNVTLMIWDIHGEDEFQKVRQFYLRGISGYLLVADGTRCSTLEATLILQQAIDRESAVLYEEERKFCEERGILYEERGKPPFILLLNKADLNDDWEIEQSEIASLETSGWIVIKTSAKTGMGVEEAFLKITTLILEL